MNPRRARSILRFDGGFLVFAGIAAMSLELVGHFSGSGPLAHLLGSPYTIGGVEAHGLATMFGFMLLQHASSADTQLRRWHAWAGAIHLLLGGANLLFWSSFVSLGLVPVGVVTTAAHALFVAAHAVCLSRRSAPTPAR